MKNYTATLLQGTLTITPVPLTLTAAGATRAYGQTNPVFTGTVAGLINGDNITVSCATPAASGSPVGAYPIVPSPVDPDRRLGNYTLSLTNGTLTIAQALLTVAAADATRAYGQTNPVFTGTIAGLASGDNITAAYSCLATPASPLGSYPIVPSPVDPGNLLTNYQVSLINGVLTVTPAVPLLAWTNPADILYGTALDTNQLNAAASVPGSFAYSPAAGDRLNAGTNTLSVLFTPDDAADFLTATAGVSVVVLPAPLSVTAADAMRSYGAANPILTGVVVGLVNGDNITATYATAATAASPVGAYPISPSLVDPDNRLANYAPAVTNGTLLITPAPLTVTAAGATRVYGQTNPVFTGTILGLANGDNITAVYSCLATTLSPPGAYPIVPSVVDPGNLLTNYLLSLINGTLTVVRLPRHPPQCSPQQRANQWGHHRDYRGHWPGERRLGLLRRAVGGLGGCPQLDEPHGGHTALSTWNGDVVVTNADGQSAVLTNAFTFTYLERPLFKTVTQSAGVVTLTWSASAGQTYQVQYKTQLKQADWDALGSPLTATNSTASASDVPGPDAQRFYRVVRLP